jgi:hypothetical protein
VPGSWEMPWQHRTVLHSIFQSRRAGPQASLSATALAVRISRDYRHHFPVANLVGNGDAAARLDGTL